MVILTLLRTTLFVIALASISVSGLPVPDASGAGNDIAEFELPQTNFSCEEQESSREANLLKLGSLETGLTVLQNTSSKLNDEWVSEAN